MRPKCHSDRDYFCVYRCSINPGIWGHECAINKIRSVYPGAKVWP